MTDNKAPQPETSEGSYNEVLNDIPLLSVAIARCAIIDRFYNEAVGDNPDFIPTKDTLDAIYTAGMSTDVEEALAAIDTIELLKMPEHMQEYNDIQDIIKTYRAENEERRGNPSTAEESIAAALLTANSLTPFYRRLDMLLANDSPLREGLLLFVNNKDGFIYDCKDADIEELLTLQQLYVTVEEPRTITLFNKAIGKLNAKKFLQVIGNVEEDFKTVFNAMESEELTYDDGEPFKNEEGLVDLRSIAGDIMIQRALEITRITAEAGKEMNPLLCKNVARYEILQRGLFTDFKESEDDPYIPIKPQDKYAILAHLCRQGYTEQLQALLLKPDVRLSFPAASKNLMNHDETGNVRLVDAVGEMIRNNKSRVNIDLNPRNKYASANMEIAAPLDYWKDATAKRGGLCLVPNVLMTIANLCSIESGEVYHDEGRVWIPVTTIAKELTRTTAGARRGVDIPAFTAQVDSIIKALASTKISITTQQGINQLEGFDSAIDARKLPTYTWNNNTYNNVWGIDPNSHALIAYAQQKRRTRFLPLLDLDDTLHGEEIWIYPICENIINELVERLKGCKLASFTLTRNFNTYFAQAACGTGKSLTYKQKKAIVEAFERILKAMAKTEAENGNNRAIPIYLEAVIPEKGQPFNSYNEFTVTAYRRKRTPLIDLRKPSEKTKDEEKQH